MSDVTYVFRDDKTYAIREGRVIASDIDPGEVERQVKQADGPRLPPAYDTGGSMDRMIPPTGGPHDYPAPGTLDACPQCGSGERPSPDGSCPVCGYHEDHDPAFQGNPGFEGGQMPRGTMAAPSAGHPAYAKRQGGLGGYPMASVITPNGLKGTVLGKVAGLWGDEVTVRLENGRIVKLPTGTELHAAPTQKVAAGPNPVERLEHRLAAVPDGTRESLSERLRELAWLKSAASDLILDGVAYGDAQRLDTIAVTADVERGEVADALAYLDSVEAVEAPRAFTMQASDRTSSISREDASWLDESYEQMIRQAQSTDYTQLMDEGPEAFAAELPDSALADTGVTRQMASSFIAEKTAGVAREIAEPYQETFLARVEERRCAELSTRKQTHHKEAAAAEDKFKDLPDDALFL